MVGATSVRSEIQGLGFKVYRGYIEIVEKKTETIYYLGFKGSRFGV